MINCLIVDDEFDAIDIMTHYVLQTPMLNLFKATPNPLEALQIVADEKIDLIFLDIQMPELSGIDFAKAVTGDIKVILTTAYSDFAVEAYELEIVDYLLKPISFPRFLTAVQRAAKQINGSLTLNNIDHEDDFIFVKTGSKGKIMKIELNEIHYIEAMNNYVAIHHNSNKALVYTSLKELEDRLPPKKFIRVQKSYIVPVSNIRGIEANKLMLKYDNVEIVIGEKYKTAIMEIFKDKLLE